MSSDTPTTRNLLRLFNCHTPLLLIVGPRDWRARLCVVVLSLAAVIVGHNVRIEYWGGSLSIGTYKVVDGTLEPSAEYRPGESVGIPLATSLVDTEAHFRAQRIDAFGLPISSHIDIVFVLEPWSPQCEPRSSASSST